MDFSDSSSITKNIYNNDNEEEDGTTNNNNLQPMKNNDEEDGIINRRKKIIVSTTGITRVMLKNIKKQLKQIGATYAVTLDANVTHLIAKQLGSEKTYFASKHNIPLVKQRWLQICFENNKIMPLTGCLFQPLESFSICVSGSGIDRKEVEREVSKLGGKFTRRLHGVGSDKTTHLLALPPLASLGKVKAANEWKIPIVSFDWIKKCGKHKKYIPHDKFILPKEKLLVEETPEEEDEEDEEEEDDDDDGANHNNRHQYTGKMTRANTDIIPSSIHSQVNNNNNKHFADILNIQQDFKTRMRKETKVRLVNVIQNSKEIGKRTHLFNGIRFLFFGFNNDNDLLQLKLALRGTSGLHFLDYNDTITHIIVSSFITFFIYIYIYAIYKNIF